MLNAYLEERLATERRAGQAAAAERRQVVADALDNGRARPAGRGLRATLAVLLARRPGRVRSGGLGVSFVDERERCQA